MKASDFYCTIKPYMEHGVIKYQVQEWQGPAAGRDQSPVVVTSYILGTETEALKRVDEVHATRERFIQVAEKYAGVIL